MEDHSTSTKGRKRRTSLRQETASKRSKQAALRASSVRPSDHAEDIVPSEAAADTPDSTQPDNCNSEVTVVLEEDMSNYRRFSSRERRKTQFFNPFDTPTQQQNGSQEEKKMERYIGVRRALQFDRVKLTAQRAKPGECILEESGVEIASCENDVVCSGITANSCETIGRTILRMPKPQVLLYTNCDCSSETLLLLSALGSSTFQQDRVHW